MKTFALTLLVAFSPQAFAEDKPQTAYVPDKTCPFNREAQDPSTEKLLKAVTDSLDGLAAKCDRKLQTPIEAFKKALTELGNESGVTRFATPGPDAKGYLGVNVNCSNYPDVFRAEFEAALAGAQAGSREFPSEDYKKCLADKNATPCVRGRYLDKMREQKHRCLMAHEQDKWSQQRARYDVLAEQVGSSLNAIVTGSDQCKEGAAPYVDMALQGLGLFATFSPMFGPYGMGVALGADVLRAIVNRARPGQMLKNSADELKRRAALDRLACLYLDTLNATVECPSRLKDLREKVRQGTNAPALPAIQGPPRETVELLGRLADVQRLLQQIRAAKNDRRQLARLLSDLDRQLDKTPVSVPNNEPPKFMPLPSLRAYLNTSADWLSGFSKHKVRGSDDIFFARDVEAQGRQMKSALASYESLLDRTLAPDKVDAALQKFLGTLEPADKKEPPFDVEETMLHVLERFDPAYGFREAAASQLLKTTEPLSTGTATGAAKDKLVQAFSSLVNQMQGSASTFFDDSAAKPHLNVANLKPLSVTQRTQTFDSAVQPLFRSCSLLAGLLYYQAEIGGRRTPLTHLRGGRDEGFQFRWPFQADTFPTSCKPFLCDSLDRGVLPFHRIDPNRPDAFHEAQCHAMQTYEARLAGARRNYVTTGDVCVPPVDPAAGPVQPASLAQPAPAVHQRPMK